MDGIGIGILSEYTMDTLVPEYPKYPLASEITFDIGIFANNMEDLTPAAQEFVHMIRRQSPDSSIIYNTDSVIYP